MSLPIPPRYTNIPSGPLYDTSASDSLIVTYARLRGLAWKSKYHSTPALHLGELLEYLNMARSTFYGQLSEMSRLGWLRSEPTSPGFVKLFFNTAAGESPENWTGVQESGLGAEESRNLDSFTADPAVINNVVVVNQQNQFRDSRLYNNNIIRETSPEIWTPEYERARALCEHTILLWDEPLWDDLAIELAINACRRQYHHQHLIDTQDLLRWIAKAHQGYERGDIRKPARLVRRNVLSGRRPPNIGQALIGEILPEIYMKVISGESLEEEAVE